jgi:hypothetical protein
MSCGMPSRSRSTRRSSTALAPSNYFGSWDLVAAVRACQTSAKRLARSPPRGRYSRNCMHTREGLAQRHTTTTTKFVRHFRKAWETTILRANGHQPEWEKGSNKPLTQESHAAFRAINLHWHDLRHEYSSRGRTRSCPRPPGATRRSSRRSHVHGATRSG